MSAPYFRKFIFVFAWVLSAELFSADSPVNLSSDTENREEVVIGPAPLVMDRPLTLIAEKIVLNGKIITNRFALTITTRCLEYTANGRIQASPDPQVSNTSVLAALLAPDRASEDTPGRKGKAGKTGGRGLSADAKPGPIRIFAGIIVNAPVIDGSGQKGGGGGVGQDGQPGGDGGPGHLAKRNSTGLWHDSGPGQGGRAGAGGDPGPGGFGGDGGPPVPIELHYGKYFVRQEDGSLEEFVLSDDPNVKVIAEPGLGGKHGPAGERGPDGRGGPGGGAASSVWRSSGTGKIGDPAQASRTPVIDSADSHDSTAKANITVSDSFSQLMGDYLKADVLVKIVNLSRDMNNVIHNLEWVSSHQDTPEGKIYAQRALKALQQRLGLIKNSYAGLLASDFDEKDTASVAKLQQKNAAIMRDLNTLIEAATDQRLDETARATLLKRSEANMREVHSEAIESMKEICRDVLVLRRTYANGKQDVHRAAYTLFAPEALEEWVFRESEPGALDDVRLLNPIETEIKGDPNNQYPLIKKRQHDFEITVTPGVNDVPR